MTVSSNKRARLLIPTAVAIGTAMLAVAAGLGLAGSLGWIAAAVLMILSLLLAHHVRNLHRDMSKVISILDSQQRENTALISDKGAVLRMMRHRVRSNLQGILGLLQYDMATVREEGARKAISGSIGRIMTLSLMEETLEESGSLSGLDFGQFVRRVVASVARNLPEECASKIKIETEDLILNPDTAFPAGIIIGDVVAGLVAACQETDTGISILVRTVREGSDDIHVTVSALGLDVGDADPADSPIVRGLATQLSGNISVSGGEEYLLKLSFPEYFEAGSEMY
jgi:two-component sensor histidine kinase